MTFLLPFSVRSQANLHFDKENVERRQEALNTTYKQLDIFAQARRRNLDDFIKFFRFCNECEKFESWMKDKVCIILLQHNLVV